MAQVRSWASLLDDESRLQAERLSRSDAVSGHVALMPDAHWGIGTTVGSVIPTENAIIPAAVGVDIGCGMIAVKTDLEANGLPDTLQPLMSEFGRSIPAGVGRSHGSAVAGVDAWLRMHPTPSGVADLKGGHKLKQTVRDQLGTLGAGNHFLEVCLDERDHVWVVLHSGSRGIGNRLAMHHMRKAKDLARGVLQLEDPDLAYFTQNTPEFDAYIADMLWAQEYALQNREIMMDAALNHLFRFVGHGGESRRINCHHNFSARETHGGRSVWITRKGAIRARKGDLGVIPGSMGTATYIVSGLGNEASYSSCAHGAGRLMGRREAKRRLTTESLKEWMKGKAWNSDTPDALLDEHPEAYKPIDQVMEDQKDLVEIQHILHQILNFKGV
jgi:tRNA-splicing ligase RtcB